MQPSARILLDSSFQGYRVTTFECVFHRFTLAEWNTHRALARNSASSRAIPVEKTLKKVKDFPAWPIVWPAEQAGMQGGADLRGEDLRDAEELLQKIAADTIRRIENYLDAHPNKETRLHKSLLNRPLEWFSWHTAIITGCEWTGFFEQRNHPKAQPEFQVVAELMETALDLSTPTELLEGEWHTPLIQPDEFHWPLELRLPVSAARCARVSYLTHEGVRSVEKDLELFYDNLLAGIIEPDNPPHWSPLEHVCTPLLDQYVPGNLGTVYGQPWAQLRHNDPVGVWQGRERAFELAAA